MNTDNRREVVQFKEWLNSGERVGKAYKRGKIDKKIKNILKKTVILQKNDLLDALETTEEETVAPKKV